MEAPVKHNVTHYKDCKDCKDVPSACGHGAHKCTNIMMHNFKGHPVGTLEQGLHMKPSFSTCNFP